MKKKLLFIGLLVASFISHAQFEVRANSNNALVSDGESFTFAEAGCDYADPCNWKFSVTNTSNEAIYMRIFVDGLTNTDGSNFQLCFAGVCLNNVTLYSGYPSTAAMIPPGGTNSAGNNFWNQNPPSTTTPMSWVLRFQAFDASSNPIGAALTVTYNFEPSLSIVDNQLASIKVFPTQVKRELNVASTEALQAEFYTVLDKKVMQTAIPSGNFKIDLTNLIPQLYLIRFTTNSGKVVIKKIVVE